MNHTRAIATSTLWQIASQCTMAALSILTIKFVALGLSKELFGMYNSAYGYLQLFGILADFGLYATSVRELSRSGSKKSEVLGALILLRSIILAGSLALALTIVWVLPHWQGTPLPLAASIAAFVPFFTLLAGMLRTIFQVNFKMHFVFVAEVTQRIITTALIGGLVLMGIRGSTDTKTMYEFLAAGGVGAFVLFALSLFYGGRLIPIRIRWDGTLLKSVLRRAAPYGAAFLCMALYRQFDITLIALLRPDFDLQNAYYGPVVRMMDMAFLLPTFLLNSVLPILGQNDLEKKDSSGVLGKTLLLILLIGTVSSLFAFFWPRALVALLTTESYLSTATMPGSDTALKLLAPSMFLNGLILYSFYVLLHRHRWRLLVTALALGAILSVWLNVLLIPDRGFVGACITSVIVNTALALALFPVVFRDVRPRIGRREMFQWLCVTAGIGLILSVVAPFLTSSAKTLVGLATVAGLLILLGLLTGLPKMLRL